MFRAIKQRLQKTENGRTIVTRELECGHVAVQRSGGKAKVALTAWCNACEKASERSPMPLPELAATHEAME